MRSVFRQLSWPGIKPVLTTLMETYSTRPFTYGIVVVAGSSFIGLCAGWSVKWISSEALAVYYFLIVYTQNRRHHRRHKDKDTIGLKQRTTPAVVRIESELGCGTGFFVGEEGLVLTNAHVVGDTKKVTVVTYNNENFEGVVQSSDAKRDLAIVRIRSADGKFPIIKLGDSDGVKKDDFVMMLGSHEKMGICVATGSVVMNEPWDEHNGSLDTRTPSPIIISNILGVGPGFSGAPLIDKNGEAVGVIAAGWNIFGSKLFLCWIPESIASNVAKKFLEELRRMEMKQV